MNGHFVNLKDQRFGEKNLLNSYLKEHPFRLKKLLEKYFVSAETLCNILKSRYFKTICFEVMTVARQENNKQLMYKNKKTAQLKH